MYAYGDKATDEVVLVDTLVDSAPNPKMLRIESGEQSGQRRRQGGRGSRSRLFPPSRIDMLDVLRDKKSLIVKVKPEAMPDQPMSAMNRRGGQPEWSAPGRSDGATLKPLTKELAKEYDVKGVAEGILVADVEENSLAQKLGLRAGDVVTAVNGEPVATPKEFREALKSSKEKGAKIKLVREGARTFLFYKNRPE